MDCPATCKQLISTLHRGWLQAAGATVVGDGDVEVSALVSYAGEGLEKIAGKTIEVPVAGLIIDEGYLSKL